MTEKRQRKVLAIDDNQTNLVLLNAHLKNMDIEALLADNAETGIQVAIEQQPDLILLDIMMPGIDGHETCRRLKADIRTSSIPIIFVSAKREAEDKVAGLKLGATDYITKPFNKGELQARVGIVLQMTELQERLLLLANTDELTGLANRRHFLDILDREILQAKIRGSSLAVMMFDVDHFKNINDNYGHVVGDKILQQLSAVLNNNIYPLDIAARYGGEEFIAIMPSMPANVAESRANKLRLAIDNNNWDVNGKQISITCSVGVAVFRGDDSSDPYDIIKRADEALYAAKERGRNCVVMWESMDANHSPIAEEDGAFLELQDKISSLSDKLKAQTLGTIEAFTKAIAVKDPQLARHADNVKTYTLAIAKKMNVSQALESQLAKSALLHDLGKIIIPNRIIRKTTPLTEREIRLIQQHPVVSTEILAPIGVLSSELQIIRHHHEHYDGSGYPNGLKQKNIPIGSRILAVADTFDAMTVKHRNDSIEDVVGEIISLSGIQFDPEVIDAFKAAFAENHDLWPLSKTQHAKHAV